MSRANRVILPIAVFGVLIAALIYSQRDTGPLKVSGFVEADQIRVGSRVGGRVARVLVQEGQVVRRGALLLELEPFDLVAQRAKAEAERDAAEHDHRRLVAGHRPEEIAQIQADRDQLAARLAELEHGPRKEEVATGEARLRQAEAQLALAQQEHKRASELSASARISAAALDKAIRTLRDAEGTLDIRKQELALLHAGTRPEVLAAARAVLQRAEAALTLAKKGFRDEEIARAKAQLAAAEANLTRIVAQVAELRVVAPVDGVIEAVDLQPGDLVTANAPVLSIMDMRSMWIRAYVPENHLHFQPGHQVDITVDSFPGRTFHGSVSFLSRQAEFTPGNVQTPEERAKQVFRIKVTVVDDRSELRPGMAADVWLEPRR